MTSSAKEAAERDRRRLHQLEALVGMCERGDLSLSSFLHDVNALLGAFEQVDTQWSHSFKSEWWTIEQVFAASKEPDLKPSDDQARALVRESLANMRKLLAAKSAPA